MHMRIYRITEWRDPVQMGTSPALDGDASKTQMSSVALYRIRDFRN
jgi:hypothetical protein